MLSKHLIGHRPAPKGRNGPCPRRTVSLTDRQARLGRRAARGERNFGRRATGGGRKTPGHPAGRPKEPGETARHE